ncbi:hypothetical protein PINS_up008707 [Pythium insidiosum]|nr:hypothetical protein PINS_up008707 [Pythium insidiosum]
MERGRKVVCIGAGRVAGPLVDYLLRHVEAIALHVVSVIPGEAEQLCAKAQQQLKDCPAIRPVKAHTANVVDDEDALRQILEGTECAIALVPEPAQSRVAEMCIRLKIKLVTASYPSPEIKQLGPRARDAGVPILCEMGLDPGMDHMIALKLIEDVKRRGGRVLAFSSSCGGLPAPEVANNPIKYKFSWSPVGALRAAQRPARYRDNGEEIAVPGPELMKAARKTDLFEKYDLEQIPNGDSIPYAQQYNIPDVGSIFRGTLRYQGYCHVLGECVKLGILEDNEMVAARTSWLELLAGKIKASGQDRLDDATQVFLHWLGLDDPSAVIERRQSLLAAFCEVLSHKLCFSPGERDLVLLQVGLKVEFPDGTKETINAELEAFGDPRGSTAMAVTVGYTAAIGATLLLGTTITSVGVFGPTKPEVFTPALKLLANEGIEFCITSKSS